MKTVWVIEQGCYSDYGVRGVYSTEANARRIADIINANAEMQYDEAEVAEWQLDPCISEIDAGKYPYHVVMDIDGKTERVERQSISGYEVGNASPLRVWERTKAEFWKGRPITDAVTGTVWTKTDKQAVKIANEFRTRMIAAGKMNRRTTL